MVTNCVQIFGNEVPFAFTAGKRLVRVRSDSDGTKYRIHSKQDNMLPRDSVSSTEMEYGESGDEAASPQSTISKDSALTASDSNLYTEQEQSSSNRRESTGSRGNNTAGNRRHGSSYSWKSSSGCGGSVSERDAVEKRGAFCRSKSDDVRVSSESLNGNGGSLPSSLQEDTPFLSGEITASGSMPSLCGEDDMLDTKMMAPAGLPRTYSDIPTSPTKLKSHPMLQRRQTPPKAPPATRRLPGQPPTAPNLVERRERPGAAGQGYVDVSGGWSRPLRQSRVSPRRKHGMGSKSAPSSPETDRALETGQSSRNISLPSYDWAVEQNARVSPGSMSHYVQQSWQLESANKPSRIALDRSYSVGVTTSTASELSTSLGSMSYKAAKSHFYVPHTQASVPEYTTVVTAEVLSGGQMKPNMTTVIHPIIHGKDSPSQSTKKKTMFYHRVSTSGAATPPTRTDLPNFKSKSRSLDTWQKKQGYFYQPESNRDLEVPFHRSSTYSSVRNKSRKDEAFSSFVKDTDMSDFQVNRPRSRHRGLSQKFSFSERSVTEPNIPLTSYQHEVRTSSSMDSCENEMRKFDCDFGLSGSFPEVRRIKSVDQLRQRLESSGVDSSPLPDRRAVVSAFESRSAENFKKPYSSRPFQLKTDISGRYVGLTQPSSHIGAFRRYSPSGHNSPGLLSASSKHHGPPRLRRLPLQRSFDSAMDDISAEEDSTPDEENSELFSGLEESFV
ncbi:uncharacterized protein LOC134186392 [Corticium candelabrum]|uniref:uncharacterized protein LOC134186392 n=1 Tax=Corticium candelabrum TaxID=121492 RepID=UPI002E262934|nr:uncharacterized protein LOC134186392 [Corticium candelabrum]